MYKAAADTSALVSIGIAGLAEKCLEIAEINVPEAVMEELEEISSYADEEGKAAKAVLGLVKNGKIIKSEVKDGGKVHKLLSKDVDKGEAECFVLCIERGIKKLVMDDVDAGYSLQGLAKSEGIVIRISVALIAELLKKNRLSKKEALEAVGKMAKAREWEGGVLEVLAGKYFSL